MVTFSKKGQTATEYMIILAVVIIIALIVVSVMGNQIPGIGVGAKSKTSSAFWKTADIAITSSAAHVDDSVLLKIRNNLADTIIINYVNMSSSGSTDANYTATEQDITLGSGTTKEFHFTDVKNICNAKGDAWSSNIWIKYTDQETGASYIFEGQGNKLEGVCAE